MSEEAAPRRDRGVTRRRLLAGGGAFGLAAATGGGFAAGRATAAEPGTAAPGATDADEVVAFDGARQAGIATPPQQRLVFAAFDLTTDRAGDLEELLRTWTDAGRRLARGAQVAAPAPLEALPPTDTGEADGLHASRLTLTFGLGPGLFERGGEDRLGLRAKRPAHLRPLPALPGDQLEDGRVGGDLCVQACADDPQVAFHAVRNLLRIGRGVVELRWLQLGFGANTSTSRSQATPRNLMGFKDGTRNLQVDDPRAMDRFVWVGADEPQAWMRGGTYVVARRIRMLLEAWDRDPLDDQEQVIGRRKASGAPLSGFKEFDEPNFATTAPATGQPVIPETAHIRLAAPEQHGGVELLRRGYAYTDGIDARTGLLDAGLFFICFQNDPDAGFVAIQRKLGTRDGLAEYLQHTGGGLWAIPPGARPRGYVGDGLFARA